MPKYQRGQQRVEQAAGPRPVGGRPEHVARLREEVVRMDEARDVADDQAVRLERPLRRAGRAAGVDDQCRIVRGGSTTWNRQPRPRGEWTTAPVWEHRLHGGVPDGRGGAAALPPVRSRRARVPHQARRRERRHRRAHDHRQPLGGARQARAAPARDRRRRRARERGPCLGGAAAETASADSRRSTPRPTIRR